MGAFESLLMFLGAAVCHQIAERSYSFGDFQMPLCARCIGIHLGFLASVAFLVLRQSGLAMKLPGIRQMVLLAAIMLVFFVDTGLSYSGLSTSDNLRRTLSGLAAGIPLPFILVPLLNVVLRTKTLSAQVLSKPVEWLWLAGIYGVVAAAILLAERSEPLFYLVSVLGVGGVFVFFSTVFSIAAALGLQGRELNNDQKLLLALSLAFAAILGLATIHEVLFSDI